MSEEKNNEATNVAPQLKKKRPKLAERKAANKREYLEKLPAAERNQAATKMAMNQVLSQEIAVAGGKPEAKVLRRERSAVLKATKHAVQQCVYVADRIIRGDEVPEEMLQAANKAPIALTDELIKAGAENRTGALIVAARVSQAMAAIVTAALDGQEAIKREKERNESAAILPVANVATSQVTVEPTVNPADIVGLPRRRGAPSQYTLEKGLAICEWIQSGRSLASYLQKYGGQAGTIYKWIAENREFAVAYSRAHEDRADTLADDILDIADGLQHAKSMVEVIAGKTRIETRQWIAAKMKPGRYGDKVEHEHKVSPTFNIGVPQRVSVPVQPAIEQR
jgi:hypothetical protein